MMHINRITPLFSALFLLLASLPAQGEDFVIFDSLSYRSHDLSGLPQWQNVLTKWSAEKQKFDACRDDFAACESHLMIGWNAFISRVQTLSPYERLSEVNRYANSQKSDKRHGAWKSPLEYLSKNGSASDRVLLKYFLLREVGFDETAIRLVLVSDSIRSTRSLLVMVKAENGIKILSNQGGALFNQADFAAFVPIVSFNETARWVHVLKQVI